MEVIKNGKVTFPLRFKIILGWSLLTIILAVVKYFVRDKSIHKIVELPTERKVNFLKSCVFIIKMYKLLFWAFPLQIVLCFIFYKYLPAEFFHITTLMIIVYFIVLEDFLYRKFLVKKIKQN